MFIRGKHVSFLEILYTLLIEKHFCSDFFLHNIKRIISPGYDFTSQNVFIN